MQIKIESVGTVELLAQFDTTMDGDTFRSSVVLVNVTDLQESFVVWRIQTNEHGRHHAFSGQYYTDRSAALGRFIRRTAMIEHADLPAMAL
jgi:hypothetical protein